MSVGKIAMGLYHSLTRSETTSIKLKENKQKEFKEGVSELSCDTVWPSDGYLGHLREIIIYCIPTP